MFLYNRIPCNRNFSKGRKYMIKIIPKPYELIEKEGFKQFDENSTIYISKELEGCAESFLFAFPLLKEHRTFKRTEDPEKADIRLVYNKLLPKEAYRIESNEKKLSVFSGSESGILYAAVSIKQTAFFEKEDIFGRVKIPCFEVFDKPRFRYRGVQLDESRHFFGAETVKRLLRLMAFYKLNVLHWHLTDDQGWRIEIKKYPLLTEIGSKRKDTGIHGWHSTDFEGKPYGGFYTQEQIKEIIAYAQKFNITIIPEIDMPAHFAAAMASYNWLGCREIPCEVHWFFGGAVPLKMHWRDWNRSACAGKESTYEFIFGVIDEVAELFPSKYFHIGGDEAPKDEWKKCPECQKRMKENGLSNVEDLQGYFNNRIASYLKEKGKTLIVWNEALAANNLDPSVVGQYWTPKNDKNVLRELKKGREMIISKHQAFYFDMPYCKYPLSNTYDFEPTDKIVPQECEKQILGMEGHLWTEWIADRDKLDMQLFPRALALAEDCWSKKNDKDSAAFYTKLNYHKRILKDLGVNYAEDEISMPKGLLHRRREISLWNMRDQYREVRKNRELKKEEN